MLAVRRPVTILALAALALLAAAAPASTASAQRADPKQMVLRLVDLPAGFTLDKGRYADNARAASETAQTTAADFARWGRINGYEAKFTREARAGIIILTSRASTYKTAAGATASTRRSFAFGAKRQKLPDGTPIVYRQVSTGAKIGHEARMFSTTVRSEGLTVAVYVVVWRYASAKATLFAFGLRDTVDPAQVVRLALKQQARIATALA